ncbi:MAG: type IV pilin N-terminal domain-containing protein [Methanoregula sp.]|uniref:type IV pilin N-terminal domain-containing protein n=1 Tax=Methanoregula sp. TaxID=2052170 RepID=UPI0025CC354C|nr:type IV pilin N-terminal domain-containing protein [Methanoregula sp.]MCK9632665.1 type IV pilin N-terminal domain-containing protein [Methanoregula sp.]
MEQEQNRHEDAVSPVIGVMLMIVVTIIIAAIVSAFAGGLAGDQKKTPSVQIDVQLREDLDSSGSAYTKLVLTHMGGDILTTRDLRIITTVTMLTGKSLECYGTYPISQKCSLTQGKMGTGMTHVTDGSIALNGGEHFSSDAFLAGTGSSVTNDGYPCKVVNGACNPANQFGNILWMNGDSLTTVDADSTATVLGTDENLKGLATMTVDIVYTPNNEIILHKDVMSS